MIKSFTITFIISYLLAPSPPLNLRAETISNTTLLIQWEQPVALNGVIRNYSLITNYGGSTSDQIFVDGQLRMYLLNELSIHQSVQLSIAASTDGGLGPTANYITATVLQTAGKLYCASNNDHLFSFL